MIDFQILIVHEDVISSDGCGGISSYRFLFIECKCQFSVIFVVGIHVVPEGIEPCGLVVRPSRRTGGSGAEGVVPSIVSLVWCIAVIVKVVVVIVIEPNEILFSFQSVGRSKHFERFSFRRIRFGEDHDAFARIVVVGRSSFHNHVGSAGFGLFTDPPLPPGGQDGRQLRSPVVHPRQNHVLGGKGPEMRYVHQMIDIPGCTSPEVTGQFQFLRVGIVLHRWRGGDTSVRRGSIGDEVRTGSVGHPMRTRGGEGAEHSDQRRE
mmetsp:Transcript_381/g.722  ORF Transcript_381/g.722 Transcript_381/m.722 type:complete len:263 (-) Transcript_381:902-1690(-)